MYIYVLSVALAHRHDTIGSDIPPIWEINPHNFVAIPHIKAGLAHAKNIASDSIAGGVPEEPPRFETGTHRDPEYKLAWWREDIELNAHHFNWHKVRSYQHLFSVFLSTSGIVRDLCRMSAFKRAMRIN